MSMNGNLNKAKKEKNDEFYTRYEDIEKELIHYKEHFKGKVVYTNCDDPRVSNFFKYFFNNFNNFGLKKLIATHYNKDNEDTIYKYEVNNLNDGVIKTHLKGDGDFSSDECIDLLKEADIVVSNPPFSLFRKYIQTLVDYDKKFLIIGNNNAITYKDIFTLIKDNKLWLGNTNPKKFLQPDGELKGFGNIGWFTNLEIKKREEWLELTKKYEGNEDSYPKYDNYDAINIDRVKDIPYDYDGHMGVPITFMNKYNPNQFNVVAKMTTNSIDGYNLSYPYVKGKRKYARLIITHKKGECG